MFCWVCWTATKCWCLQSNQLSGVSQQATDELVACEQLIFDWPAAGLHIVVWLAAALCLRPQHQVSWGLEWRQVCPPVLNAARILAVHAHCVVAQVPLLSPNSLV